jgi:uncharacterized protein (TIGR02246 family)
MADSPEQVHAAFQHAFNRHDLEGVVASYEADAVMISGNAALQGADAIREAYRGIFAQQPTIALQTVRAVRAGDVALRDVALLHGQWELRGTGPEGAEIRRSGLSAEVVRRQADGRWLFVIDNPASDESR